jgi:hypothetical protein
MIKFFRRIRQNLLNEGKTSKYFKYAIGEIVLVVIGILIALQVSNWNQKRITQNETEVILDKFEEEMKLTIFQANHDISNSVMADSIIKAVLNSKVTHKDYIEDERLRYLLTWRFTLNPKLDNLDKLLETEEILDEQYKDILIDIDRFGFFRDREIDAMNVLRISAEKNSDYINLNFPWARLSDTASNEKAYNYFLTDENYLNRLYTHWEKAMNYTEIISNYRSEMLLILSKLKVLRDEYSGFELEALLKELGQQPYEKIAKDKPFADLVSKDQVVKSTLIANFTNDTFKLILKNRKGEKLMSGESAPGELFIIRPLDVDLYGDYLRVLEVYKNDVHIETYKELQHGYLIFK